ncbi:hypothetical protein GW7_02797 [Heterocephalus glaber]|uniref:Uncharacterized protein n=1 Tax=Heterocephalus glaber TaxID=10181 RepID=G5C0Y5_HETGA|nr:hypothetical protein GW7_02797 [Heterocephalus glaber]
MHGQCLPSPTEDFAQLKTKETSREDIELNGDIVPTLTSSEPWPRTDYSLSGTSTTEQVVVQVVILQPKPEGARYGGVCGNVSCSLLHRGMRALHHGLRPQPVLVQYCATPEHYRGPQLLERVCPLKMGHQR